jgi:hypothetical protein
MILDSQDNLVIFVEHGDIVKKDIWPWDDPMTFACPDWWYCSGVYGAFIIPQKTWLFKIDLSQTVATSLKYSLYSSHTDIRVMGIFFGHDETVYYMIFKRADNILFVSRALDLGTSVNMQEA